MARGEGRPLAKTKKVLRGRRSLELSQVKPRAPSSRLGWNVGGKGSRRTFTHRESGCAQLMDDRTVEESWMGREVAPLLLPIAVQACLPL